MQGTVTRQPVLQSYLLKDTPARLRLFLAANSLMVLLFGYLSVSTLEKHEHAAQTIGFDAAPSVMAVHEIRTGVLQMGNDLALELFDESDKLPDQTKFARADFEKNRLAVCKNLITAAMNVTYGRSEQLPLEKVQVALGELEAAAQRARDMHEAADRATALQSFREALATLQTKMLPAANQLEQANASVLEAAYAQQDAEAALSSGMVLSLGLVMCGFLIATQVYLNAHFRRTFNVPFLISTVCTILLVQHLYTTLRQNAEHLKVAKVDSYNSIVDILRSKSSAYEANSALTYWFLDRDYSADYEKLFEERAHIIANLDAQTDFAGMLEQLRRGVRSGEKLHFPKLSGTLPDELRNVTFVGEGDAALDALQNYFSYFELQSKAREMYSAGEHTGLLVSAPKSNAVASHHSLEQMEAMRVALGYNPAQAQFYFSKMDDCLSRLLVINREHFDHAIGQSVSDLKGLAVLCQGICLFVIIAVYLGLRPRLAEYNRS